MFLKNKVGLKLMGVNLASLLFALICLLIIIQYLATNQVLAWHRQRVELVANLVLAEYQGKNQRVVQYADILGNNYNYAELLYHNDIDTLARLAGFQMRDAGLNILTVTDRTGVIVVRVHAPKGIGVDISGNPLIKAALKGKRTSRMTQWKDSISLSAAAPLYYGDEVVGVVLTGMLVDKGFVESLSKGTGAEVAIFFADHPVVNSFQDLPESAFEVLKSGKNRAALGLDSVQSLLLGKKNYTLTFLPLEQEEKPWENLLVVGVSQAELKAAEKALHLVIFGVGGGAALVGMFLSFMLSLGMRRQISHLAEGTRQATREELAGDIPVTSTDELGELAESFNTMTRALREKTRLLQEERDRIAANADFLSMIVHDIKAPLTGVRLTIETLQDESLPTDIHHKLQGIIESSEGLLLHLHNVLDISRHELGQLILHPEVVYVGFTIQRLLNHYSEMAANQGISLRAKTNPALPPVWADERYLDRVLFNLMANSLEATPAGGFIEISAHASSLNGGAPAVEIVVADSGCGIDPQNLDNLFEKYLTRGSHRAGGSGLGLYICKTIIEAHHGKIWAASQPGQGTRIHLLLPQAGATELHRPVGPLPG
ncbi:MAG: HAMP domain-containing protein [Deltaproteobacteria bacterium]|nr:HAMP domain-containing protein [Deltaproteobacteria bacterium]